MVISASACRQPSSPQKRDGLGGVADYVAEQQAKINKLPEDATERKALATHVNAVDRKLRDKRLTGGLVGANTRVMAHAMGDHTKLYPLVGQYRVMVIPVQFADVSFARPEFFTPDKRGEIPAQDYLFGDHGDSMSQYFKHASMGAFQVKGQVMAPVTVDKPMAAYGEAVTGTSDKDARGLVVDALLKLQEVESDPDWWSSFDRWDLGDYDNDQQYYEPDGFLDAVVLIYAGKSQAACQRSFDPDGKRPASAEVPPGPRQAAAIECFNRIWPHRWSISLAADHPRYSHTGPAIEGEERPSFNGLKITDEVFALDYNMQSEFSDRSTFFHEFGHSLSLPDVYASSGENSVGEWELMAHNAELQAQELSSYSKLSLGWLSPKIVQPGEKKSAYLGAYSFVSKAQREESNNYEGPQYSEELVGDVLHKYDVVSTTPEFGEPVYRSLVVLTDPSEEQVKVTEVSPAHGKYAAYSDRFDGGSRAFTLKLQVPMDGDATLKFDTIYHIETETNFDGNDVDIKVITDYDIGEVKVQNETIDKLRTVSGDDNHDTLSEQNTACPATRVLELRTKKIAGQITEEEKKEFAEGKAVCQSPTWITKSYDLGAWRGREVAFEIRYTTDAGYTEFGVVVDNLQFGGKTWDFESGQNEGLGEFVLLHQGQVEKRYQQFYLMEYRDPQAEYRIGKSEASYNMDRNIDGGNQSLFLTGEGSLSDRFRVLQPQYQPGVLVWYFNAKFNRTSNSASVQDSKGYLLVVNPEVRDMNLPGVFADPSLKDEKGFYRDGEEDFKAIVKEQRDLFICYGHTAYETYLSGAAPDCQNSGAEMDAMRGVTHEGKALRYRREWFNEILPTDRYNLASIGEPYRNVSAIRTGLSTFRPKEAEPFKPYQVFKNEKGTLILDQEMTAQVPAANPVSEFSARRALPELPAHRKGDIVRVEPSGLRFTVAKPAERILKLYGNSQEPDADDFVLRQPRAKVLINWE